MRIRVFSVLFVVASVLVTAGCSYQKMPLVPADRSQVDSSNAIVHVYRPSYLGYALSFPVRDDGKLVGSLGVRRSLSWERPAGEMTMTTAQSDMGQDSELTILLEPGQEYYYRLSPAMGFFVGGGTFSTVSEQTGQKGLKKCKQAKYKP